MSGADFAGRLASRLADAYGIAQADVLGIVDASAVAPVDLDQASLERHGDDVLLIVSGEVATTIALGGILPAVAPACDTLDPYGDREDMLVASVVHDPHAPRIAPQG